MTSPSNPLEKCLREYKAKPLKPLETTALLQCLDDPQVSLDALRPFYRRDPILGWYILAEAQQQARRRASQPFAIDHAISLLGLGGVRQLANRLANLPESPLSIEVKFMLSSSLLAAELAKHLGDASLGKPQTRWSALCYQQPDTLLWYLNPKAMWRIYYRRLTLPKKMRLFEEAKLGFNLGDWEAAVAENCQMSEHLLAIYRKPLPENPREIFDYARHGLTESTPSLKEWHRREEWLVVLCNRLARAVLSPWHGTSFKHQFELLQRLLGLDARPLRKILQFAIAQVSQDLAGSQLIVPAQAYLMLPSRPPFPEWLTTKQPIAARVARVKLHRGDSHITSTDDDKDEAFDVVLKSLIANALRFPNSAQLVHEGLKTALDFLHFERVSFLAVERAKYKVVTRFALASDGMKPVHPDFAFNPPTPLQRFVEQPGLVSSDRNKHAKIWPQLPESIRLIDPPRFIIASLKPGKQVRALLYFDGNDATAYSPHNLQRVKALLKAMAHGLQLRNLAEQRRAEVKNAATPTKTPRQASR